MKPRVAGNSLQGWLLIFSGLGIGIVLWFAPGVSASSRNSESSAKRDFDSLVHAISGRYQIQGKTVPMMWLANLCASRFTHGGVRAMKVVEFEDAGRIATDSAAPAEFGDLVKAQLGERWTAVVREHDKNGADSYIYVQDGDEGNFTRLIVVDLDGKELDMVSISLNPDQLAKWMTEHDAIHAKTFPAGESDR